MSKGVENKSMIDREFINKNLILDNRGKISWKNSIGKNFSVIYDGVEYAFVITNYDKDKRFVYFKFTDNDLKEFSMNTNNLLKGAIGNVIGKYSLDYKYHVGDIVNDNEILNFTRIKIGKHNSKAYFVRCIHDNHERTVLENSLDHGCTCPVCTNKLVVKGINDLWTVRPDIAKLLKNPEEGYKYSVGSGKYLLWICPNCKNEVRARIPDVIYNYGHLRCNKCSDGFSYPEKLMANILYSSNIKFKQHIKFKNFKFIFKGKMYCPEYDFLINYNNRNIIIEMDGDFHNRPHRKSKYTIDDIKYIDNQKDLLAIKNGYEIIRIDCSTSEYNYILNSIINSPLNNVIDISSLNEKEINCNAYSSLLVKACKLYMTKTKNPNTIARMIGIPYSRTQIYLSKGAKIGLCDYDPDFSLKNRGNLDFVGTYEVVI